MRVSAYKQDLGLPVPLQHNVEEAQSHTVGSSNRALDEDVLEIGSRSITVEGNRLGSKLLQGDMIEINTNSKGWANAKTLYLHTEAEAEI